MSARSFAAVLLAGVCATAAAAPAVREQFAWSVPLEFAPGEALQRLELPLVVYRDTMDPALRDLRVLNGKGEEVPFALERPPSVVARSRPPGGVGLPMFPLRGDPAEALSALNLSIRADSATVELQSGSRPQEAPLTAYLLDAQHILAPLEKLTFQLPADAADFSMSAVLEASDDLADWRVVVARVPLARLRHGGEGLEHLSVSVPPMRARFWRLSAPPGGSLPAIASTFAELAAGSEAVDRQVIAVPGQAAGAGEYLFDLGAQIPVDRLALELPDLNTVAQVDYFARRAPADAWRHVARAAVQRLQAEEGEVRSEPLAIPLESSRYWRAVVDPRGGGLGSGIPGLRAGWLAHQVLFVARGAAPFELVYGRYGAENAAVPLDELVPDMAAFGSAASFMGGRARAGAPRLAGGLERLQAPPPPGNWRLGILWTALGIGVLSLGAVAWRLARQLRVDS